MYLRAGVKAVFSIRDMLGSRNLVYAFVIIDGRDLKHPVDKKKAVTLLAEIFSADIRFLSFK